MDMAMTRSRMILLFGLLCFSPALAAASRSIQFNGTRYAATQSQNSAELANVPQFRLEFRLHELSASSNAATIFYLDTLFCRLENPGPKLVCIFWPTGANLPVQAETSLAGRADVRVRFQVNASARTASLETWDGNGANYTIRNLTTPSNISGNFRDKPQSIGGVFFQPGVLNNSIAFLRLYTGNVPVGSRAPGETAAAPGNIINYEFENTLQDQSGRNRHLQMTSGSASYLDSPVFAPIPLVDSIGFTRATRKLTMRGDRSFASIGSGEVVQYEWNQPESSEPRLEFSAFQGPQIEVTLPVQATYTLRLKVTDASGQTAETLTEVSAVVTDEQDRVIVEDANMSFLLGPLIRSGASPWSWFDETEIGVGFRLREANPVFRGGTVLPGTLTVTRGSNVITGTGTSFLSTFACNGTDFLVIHYPAAGGDTGRRAFQVQSCPSDTSLTVLIPYDASSGTTSGVAYGYASGNDIGAWTNGSNNWNYYDNVAAFYRLYYRTGNRRYLEHARNLADQWWLFPLDQGRMCSPGRWACSAMRIRSLLGMMMRAVDGRPEMWPGIVALVDDQYDFFDGQRRNQREDYDIRELGYQVWFYALLAKVHPNPQERARMLNRASSWMTDIFLFKQRSDGSWRMVLDVSQGYSGAGTLPWQMAFIMKGLMTMHQVTGENVYRESLLKALNFLNNYSYVPFCRGQYYAVFYTTCEGAPCPAGPFNNGQTGTVLGGGCSATPSFGMGPRTLSNALHDLYGYAYFVTGDARWRTMGDNLFAANLGGNGSGPAVDGGSGNYNDVILFGTSFQGKEFGFVGGAGGAQAYLGYRLGPTPAATLSTMNISVDSAELPLRLTVTRPSGVQTVTTCSATPCVVQVDRRQGTHLLSKQSLNAQNEPIGEPVQIKLFLSDGN